MKVKEDQSSSQQTSQQIRLLATTFIILQLILVVAGFFVDLLLGFLLVILAVASYVIMIQLKNKFDIQINDYVQHLSSRVKEGEDEALIKMPIGIILYSDEDEDEIEWLNPYMMALIEENNLIGSKMSDQVPELAEQLEKNKDQKEFNVYYNDCIFRVLRESDNNILYLMDDTKHYQIEAQFKDNRPVIGFLLFDNYDELTRKMDDREILRFDTMMTTYFSNWFKQRNIYYKKIENDRYLLFTNHQELSELIDDKFSIIDNIRERTSKRGVPLTISLGLSYSDYGLFEDMAEEADNNIDLALARGGDQAIVNKVGEDPSYYGGKSDPMVKRTRVRSRMVTQALEGLFESSDSIFVMGHKGPDLDAIGSALGVRRIAELNYAEAYVVIDESDLNKDVRLLMDEVMKNEQIAPYIISPREARRKCNENSLVVMVDHHRASLSIAPELVEKSKRVVVIDHHRRGNEFPNDPILVYIEPYASSASELVTEMFEYVTGEGPPINALEATALLGGIVVDSNNFSLRTGSRTFNAASYLQSVGADNSKIRDLLAEDPEVYLGRSRLIATMEKVAEGVYIAKGGEDEVINPVVAAQTADTMLSFSDVQASFVISKRPDGRVGISARSAGYLNVQLVMEQMGGGGHLSNAATQIEDASIEEVEEELIEVIHESLEE